MLVSLIIPSFNRAVLVTALWNSVIKQSYRPIEFVLVDDGSTDGTAQRFAEIAAKSGREDVCWRLLQTPNRGAPAARNAGVRACRGDAVMFVDSDDVFAPQGIEVLVRALTDCHDFEYAYGLVQRTDGNLNPLREAPIGSLFQGSASEFAGYHWHTMGALYRRSCIEAVGEWNEQLKGSQDWEYQARVKAFGGEGAFVQALVGFWRQHSSQRVGASGFRPDYISSVLLACELIVDHASRIGKCDGRLRKLMARRVMVHGVECGAHGHTQLKQRCSLLARQLYKERDWFGRSLDLVSVTPPLFDKALHAMLLRRRS